MAYLLDPRDYVESIASSLRQQPPMPYWASPPLCCIFYLTPCCFLGQPGTATARLLKFCRHGLLGYLVGMPLVPFLSLLVKAQFERGKHALLLLGLVWCQWSLSLFALYALFITYRLTRVPLKDFRTTAKFATIKAG